MIKLQYKTILNKYLFLFFLIPALFYSCKKTDDFIAEDKVGNGIHYYPVILNNVLLDTASDTYLNLADTVLSLGDTVILELDYYSQDSLSRIELWAGKPSGSLEKEGSFPFQPPFITKDIDTVFISYIIPPGLDSTIKYWMLEPRVITMNGFQAQARVKIPLE